MSRKSEQLRRQERMEILLTTLMDYKFDEQESEGLFSEDLDDDAKRALLVHPFSAGTGPFTGIG